MSRGFTILEVLVAILVLSIGVGGSFALLTRIIGTTSVSSNRLVASYLAQEGIEIVRNIRDTNFLEIYAGGAGAWTDDGLLSCAGACEINYNDTALVPSLGRFLNIDGNGLYSYQAGTPTIFQRTVTITSASAEQIIVEVDVFWEERGRTNRVEAVTELYNWLNPSS